MQKAFRPRIDCMMNRNGYSLIPHSIYHSALHRSAHLLSCEFRQELSEGKAMGRMMGDRTMERNAESFPSANHLHDESKWLFTH